MRATFRHVALRPSRLKAMKDNIVELGIGQQKQTDIDMVPFYDFPILGTDISDRYRYWII